MDKMYWLYITVVLLVALAGCSGKGVLPSNLADAPNPAPEVSTDPMGLVSPIAALEQIPDRNSSYLVLKRNGWAFAEVEPQRVEAEDTSARFSPDWTDGASGFGQLAFAIYSFRVQGYEGINEVLLDWGEDPSDYSNLFVGFSNWDQNSWEWFPGPADGSLDFSSSGYGGFARPDTGYMLVAIVMMGTDEALLDRLTVGYVDETPRDDWLMFGHDPQHTHRSPFVGNQTGKLKWEFETEGDGLSFYEATIGADGTVYVSTRNKFYAYNPDGTVKWISVDYRSNFAPAIASDGTIYSVNWWGWVSAINSDGSLKWLYQTAQEGFISAAVVGPEGTVYIDGRNNFYAINPDGSEKWVVVNPIGFGEYSYTAVGPDGTIILGNDKLTAFNPDGSIKWRYPDWMLVLDLPTIGEDGTIYVGTALGDVHAINPDGSLKWLFDTEKFGVSSPAVGEDGSVYVSCTSNKMLAINPDGTEKWSHFMAINGKSSTRIGPDGNVYVASSWKKLYAFTPGGDVVWTIDGVDLGFNNPTVGSDGTIYGGRGGYVTSNSAYFYSINPEGSINWKQAAGNSISSSPAITRGGYVCFGNQGKRVYSLNMDGTERWSTDVRHIVESSPVIANGLVYVNIACVINTNNLYALAPNGELKKQIDTGGVGGHSSPVFGLDYVMAVGSTDNNLHTFNPDDTKQWSYATGGEVNSSPAMGVDGTLYVGSSDGKLYALNLDGSLKWSYTTGDEVQSSPAIGTDGTVYVGSYDDNLYAINPDGSLQWSYTTGGDVHSSPGIGLDGTIYVGSKDNKLYAINIDGTLQWAYATGGDVDSSPAIDANGTIYVGSNDTKVYAINPDGTHLWSYETRDYVYSSPAIGADGTVYIGSQDGKLYAFGE